MTILPTLVAVVALVAVTTAIVLGLRLEHPWLQPWAILRAVIQLGLLSVILLGVISNPVWVGLFLAAMVLAAAWTVSTRLRVARRTLPFLVLTVAVASAVPVVIVFAVGAVDFTPRYVLAVGGIVVGNVMTVSTLLGRLLAAQLVTERDQVEGWLALGATPRQAARSLTRSAASSAIIPSTDQTRTTGIVTLPGAFVGAVFGGASPLAAAQFQIVVLASILAAGSVTIALMTWRFGAPRVVPTEPAPLA
ncbi:iron export ABC transporter permease subunit FetB [Frondihabitans sucicola]|uniref:Iron export ABC transporter permease subunit FetB n=1 Tax=Frondihabitans sucicola TaxID=1268041 RepID=A0ABM8GS56_9MICO|nr:ABC transporter permease [Frondihabitans sucicola]BDZ51135.1 iron export ABC transporter permease subunit FetB [Frondihabitans sucicola]